MPRLRVQSFSISIDGYGAGPNQGPDNPLGGGVPTPNATHVVLIKRR